MVKQLFQGLEIVLSGDFGSGKSHQDIKRWIEMYGGAYHKRITASTTHLIATKKSWTDKAMLVMEASKVGTLKVVSFDWLEDSIRTKRCRSEKMYLWSALEKKNTSMQRDADLRKRNELRKKVRAFLSEQKKLNMGPKLGTVIRKLERMLDAVIYQDTMGFQYSITLVRPDSSADVIETINLQILETGKKPPHFYATMATYISPGIAKVVSRLTPMASQFHEAFTQWRKFFKSRTGVAWEYRLWGAQHSRLASHEKMQDVFIDTLLGQVGTIDESVPTPAPVDDNGEVDDNATAVNYFQYYLPKTSSPLAHVAHAQELVSRFGYPPKLEVIGGNRNQFVSGYYRTV